MLCIHLVLLLQALSIIEPSVDGRSMRLLKVCDRSLCMACLYVCLFLSSSVRLLVCLSVSLFVCLCFLSPQDASALGCSGNLLLDRLCRSRLVLVPSEPYLGGVVYGKQMRGLKRRMEDYAEKLRLDN